MRFTEKETKIVQDTTTNIATKDSAIQKSTESPNIEQAVLPNDTLVVSTINDSIQHSEIDTLLVDTTVTVMEPNINLKDGIDRISQTTDLWIFIVLFIGFCIFAWVRIIFNKYLNHLAQALFNFTTASRLFRERVYKIMHAAFQLDFLYSIMIALSVYTINQEYAIVNFNTSNFTTYSIIFFCLVGYSIIRHSIYRFIGFIFNHKPEVKEYLFDNSIVLKNAGLVLLPLNTVISFSNFTSDTLFLSYSLSILLIPIVLTFRGFIIMLRKHVSIFYLILYLCTLEILPLLLISKIIENYGNG